MVVRACTWGTKEGPCYAMPAVAVWTEKGTGKKTWTCLEHDKRIDQRLRQTHLRSTYTRKEISDADQR